MRLSQQDASFIYQETASGPMQTAGIMILEGKATYKKIYEHYRKRVHLVPRLRQRLVFVPFNLAHPKWIDDPDFDLKNHIIHHKAPKDCSLQEGLDILCEVNEPVMDRNIPLWQFHVLTGVKGHTLILQQIHHAMVDGASAVQMSTVMFDFEKDAPAPAQPKEKWSPPPLPNPMELMTEAVQENMQVTRGGTNLIDTFMNPASREVLQKGMSAMTRFLTEPAITAPWNAAPTGPKRHLVHSVHDLGEFREIRRAFGGTINDIALSVASEAAARYLDEHNERTGNQKFRIMCPVNVRTEDESGALGNRVAAIFPMVPASRMPILERYEAVCNETNRIKGAGEAQAMTLMMESAPEPPPVGMMASHLVGTPMDPTRLAAQLPMPALPNVMRGPNFGINFVLTNVPGVQVPQYIAGHEVVEQAAIMMMGGNMGLGLAVGSYNQKMIFNYTCDPRLLPDLELMKALGQEIFDELLTAAREANGAHAA